MKAEFNRVVPRIVVQYSTYDPVTEGVFENLSTVASITMEDMI